MFFNYGNLKLKLLIVKPTKTFCCSLFFPIFKDLEKRLKEPVSLSSNTMTVCGCKWLLKYPSWSSKVLSDSGSSIAVDLVIPVMKLYNFYAVEK